MSDARRIPCPKGKHQFEDMEAARRACGSLALRERRREKAAGAKRKRTRLRPYICGHCGFWHAGRGAKGSDADWATRKVFLRIHPAEGPDAG